MIGALILTLVAFVCLFLKTSQKLRNCPNSRYSKYSSYSRIVKFGRKCEIWSTPISLVLKGLTEFITIGQTQTFSRIAIRGCSLNISKNHSLGLLSKCICHRHCLCLCLCCCLFVGSGHVLLSLWSNVSKVKSLKDCSLAVFSKCICHWLCHCLCICLRRCLFVGQACFLMTPINFAGFRFGLEGRKALNPTQWLREWVSEWPR